MGVSRRTAYTASKHGVVELTKKLATDLAPIGVRVNAVAPGTIRTPLIDAYFDDESFVAELKAMVPCGGRWRARGREQRIALPRLPDGAFITGVVLPVDGGWVAEKSYGPGTGGVYTSSAASAGSVSSSNSGQV